MHYDVKYYDAAEAVVREVDGLILMDADHWASARQARPDGPPLKEPTCLAGLVRSD